MSDFTEMENSELLNPEPGADSRPRSFTPAEMITCDSCLRANPPTRQTCLYCGERLLATEPIEAPNVESDATPVATAPSFYVVLPVGPNGSLDEAVLERVASHSELKLPDLKSALRAGGALLLAQTNTSKQAEDLIDEFRTLGIQTTLIANEELNAKSINKKVRAFELSDDGLTGLAGVSGERLFEKWGDLTLIVSGRLQINNVEDVVRRKRGGQKPVDRRELTNVESIFDLYSRSATEGWRVAADSFDFSCLGEGKGITAFENFRALIKLLAERAANIEVDESYLAIRPLLATVWPWGASTRSGGWRRSGAGKFDISTVTSTDNETQFSNYSRLLQCLRMRSQNHLR
jgi:hypothetical protein